MSAVARDAIGELAMLAIHGSLLVVIALAVAGRMRPAWQAAVWLIVICKFALPWTPALPWSLEDVIALIWYRPAGGASLPVAEGPHPASPSAIGASPAWAVLAIGWAIGSALVIARAIASYRRAAQLADCGRPAPAWSRAIVGGHARVVIGSDVHGPFTFGVVRPTIVLPAALLEQPALARAALLHELAHVRRRDAIARIIEVIAVAVFWWLPTVRFARRKLDQAREAACDAAALEAGQLSRAAYARLLVDMSMLHASALSLARPQALSARVARVLAGGAAPRLSRWHWLALAGWAGIALGSARPASASAATETCVYSAEQAEALRAAHPEADRDGDGVLTRDEACEFQAELARHVGEPVMRLLTDPLCCNRDAGEGPSLPASVEPATCQPQE